jgi:cell division protein FtsB
MRVSLAQATGAQDASLSELRFRVDLHSTEEAQKGLTALDPYFSFLIAGLVGLFLAGLTWWFARKSGLQPAQAALIDTLKDNVDALEDRAKLLEDQLNIERARTTELDQELKKLKAVVVDLVTENAELRRKAGMPVREVDL